MRTNEFISESLYSGQIKLLVNSPLTLDWRKQPEIAMESDKHFADSVKQAATLILRDCDSYLEEMMEARRFLYRGGHWAGAIIEGRSYYDRRPHDSEREAVDIYNQLSDQLGFQANRSNSIFCVGSKNFAKNYGDVWTVIPKDTAKFTWSRNNRFTDTILTMDEIKSLKIFTSTISDKDKLIAEIKFWEGKTHVHHELSVTRIQQIYGLMQLMYDVIATPIIAQDLIRSRMPWIKRNFPDSILALEPDSFQPIESYDIDKFEKEFQLDEANLTQAMQSKHEIMVSGEFYGVQVDLWDAMVGADLFKYDQIGEP